MMQQDQQGEKKSQNKVNPEWKVTLKTIWPQSQLEFEEELGVNEQGRTLQYCAA